VAARQLLTDHSPDAGRGTEPTKLSGRMRRKLNSVSTAPCHVGKHIGLFAAIPPENSRLPCTKERASTRFAEEPCRIHEFIAGNIFLRRELVGISCARTTPQPTPCHHFLWAGPVKLPFNHFKLVDRFQLHSLDCSPSTSHSRVLLWASCCIALRRL